MNARCHTCGADDELAEVDGRTYCLMCAPKHHTYEIAGHNIRVDTLDGGGVPRFYVTCGSRRLNTGGSSMTKIENGITVPDPRYAAESAAKAWGWL